VLLIGAGLMLRSFAQLTSVELGVRPSDVTVAHMTVVGPKYPTDDAKTRAIESVLANMRAIPGVAAAGASTSLPPNRMQEAQAFGITGKPQAAPGHDRVAIYIPATTGYLEALGIPLLRGRLFDSRDNAASPPTAIVTRELVRRYFDSGENPVGRSIELTGVSRTIVGIVGDAAYGGVGKPAEPAIYVPFSQAPFPGVWIPIRSTRDAGALTASVRDAIHRVDPELPAYTPVSLESMIGDSVVRPRFNAWLLSTFGALALILASIGVYSVIAYGVTQRRPEIGIRLALGAPTSSVVGMVLRSGMTPVVVGVAAGIVVARIASRLVAGMLYGIAPTDAPTFVGVALVFAVAGFAAAYIPARRAARVDPLTAIRAD
jgi:putative ABC transport system permease protein